MGAKDSKRTCLSYEDAVKRMSDVEFKRVCEAFKRLTGGNQLLNRHTFTHHVLGDGVPPTIADWLFNACGGGPRGIALKDLICGLVLLTRGSQDEKIKFLWTLYCNDSGTYITRNEFQTALQIEGALPADLANKPNLYWDRTLISLFGLNQDRVSFEHFRIWIQSNRDATILSQWLLSPRPCVSLSSEVETPTFYQTLAGVTHLDEHDIGELEKCFWSLQSNSPSGNLDFNCVRDMVCPPVPINACEGLFLALDVNRDGHVDFKELCCGISAASRGPKAERMKFCFKIFDMDRDCYLNSNELQHMIETLLFITNENKIYTTTTSSSSTGCNNYNNNNNNNNNNSNNEEVPDVIATTTTTTTHLLQQLLNNQENDDNNNTKTSLKLLANCLDAQGGLSQEEFLVWSVINDNCLVEPLLELLFQVCHVSLGLKPYCRHHEHDIVDGWLRREERRGYHVGQFWYLISTDWWQMWKNYTTGVRTNHDYCDCRCSNNNSSNTSNYSSSSNSSHSNANLQIEEGIVCDEGTLPSSHDYNHIIHSTNDYNNYYSTNNSMDSSSSMMSCGGGSGSVGGGGDLILTSNSNNNKNSGDNCSIASSSGVSSSSGGGCVIGNTTTVINTITTTTITNALTMTMKRTHGTGSIPGPIDNRSLVAEPQFKVATLTGEGGRLKRDIALVQHRDFVLIPDSLWKALALWYGGPLPLPRQVIRPPGSSDVELELYPLNLRILRHQQPQQQQFSGGGGGGSMATTTSTSSSSSWSTVVGGYGAAALSTAGLTSAPAALQSTRRYLAHTAAFSRLANVRQVIEFLCQRLILRVEDVRLWHIKETTNLLEDDNATLQDLGVFDCDQILLEVRNKDLTWPEELGALVSGGNNSNNNNNTTTNNGSTGGIGGLLLLNSERRPTICLPPGATGLHNLGNTCFMNAALQAVSNTRPLTMYFQRDGQLCELNSMNPLGTKGMVARRYAELCRELWAGSTRSVAPLKLRYCVTKHAPHLGGGGQHDSQELLAWLLDALHEDLNRVARKQYTELKDSGGRPDEVVADEAWTQHLARDHSIITDLFYGQLKSKVTCQMCGHESVRFDPFNLLSLPLPMESYTLCEVLVIRLNGETPVKYGLRLNSEAKYLELKEQLQFLCHIKSKRLLLAELSYSQIRQILMDDVRINPNTATELYAYELPDNSNNNNGATEADEGDENNEILRDGLMEENAAIPDSPLARSPEVRGGSALCMPNILCFKNNNSNNNNNSNSTKKTNNNSEIPSSCNNGGSILLSSSSSSSTTPPSFKKSSIISLHSSSGRGGGNSSLSSGNSTYSDSSKKYPKYLIAVHRKSVRQETYFLSQQKSKPSLFGLPLLLGCSPSSTCQSLYEAVWSQVTRLLSPLPQSDQTNHATDCDDSLGYEFPFTLKAVLQGGQICAICHWTQFCRGCILSCSSKELLFERCRGDAAAIITNSDSAPNVMCIAIDWDPTALHLRYQSSREKLWIEDESVATCRKLHTEPIDLDYCLKAFTSEERLETKYHCSNCQDKQPATKKLQIWRLPPILIIHLKRFDYVNSKWVKTQKVVNFPFKDFDPTAYLASIPHETIIRHQQLLMKPHNIINNNKSYDLLLLDGSCESQVIISEEENDDDDDDDDNATDKIVNTTTNNTNRLLLLNEHSKLMNDDVDVDHQSMSSTDNLIELKQFDDDTVVTIDDDKENNKKSSTNQQQQQQQQRRRLESTSLMKTPVIDENLKDYHQHKLLPGQDPFDLKYQLYAVVSHSGLLNGGHYISYACNPNGNWYCYNDSSCREVLTDPTNKTINNNNKATTAAAPISTNSSNGCTPLSRRKNLRVNTTSNSTTSTNNNNINNSSESLNSNKNDCNDDDLLLLDTTTTGSTDGINTVTINVPLPTASSINTTNIPPTGSSSTNLSTSNKNNNDESTSSTSSSSTAKCAYSDVRVPKIDTSSAYILFYERSGLDYKPYLPDLVTNIVNSNGSQIVPEVELDENESELRKQLCSIQ